MSVTRADIRNDLQFIVDQFTSMTEAFARAGLDYKSAVNMLKGDPAVQVRSASVKRIRVSAEKLSRGVPPDHLDMVEPTVRQIRDFLASAGGRRFVDECRDGEAA